jgi:hypothetical protein
MRKGEEHRDWRRIRELEKGKGEEQMNALEREFVSSNNFFNNPLNPISSAYKRAVSYNRSKALPF